MRIAIVDDQREYQDLLSSYIERYCSENHLAAEITVFSDGTEFIENFQEAAFEVIFMDIYMDNVNGMDIARKLREKDGQCLLIFTTVSTDYAVESFQVRAFHYLVKPYQYERFYEVMRLCDRKLQTVSHYIEVKEGRTFLRVMLRDILFADYSNHYIQLHVPGRVIKSHMYFDQLSDMLLEYPQFLCCYRNCIINMDQVRSLEERDFVMNNGDRLPIMRAGRNEIRQSYTNYIFDKLNKGDFT